MPLFPRRGVGSWGVYLKDVLFAVVIHYENIKGEGVLEHAWLILYDGGVGYTTFS